MLFKRKMTYEEKELTQEDSRAIYNLLKEEKSLQTIRLETEYRTNQIQETQEEMIKLETEINSKMSGTFVIKEEEKDKEGNVKEEQEFFKPTTERALIDSMSSDLLVVGDVVTDSREWVKGKPEEPMTWTAYKESFINEEV